MSASFYVCRVNLLVPPAMVACIFGEMLASWFDGSYGIDRDITNRVVCKCPEQDVVCGFACCTSGTDSAKVVPPHPDQTKS
eukprot:3807151-Amphidinium_carterae.1